MISANQPVPVNNSIQYENTNQRTDDIQNDVRPQTVYVDIPEIHSETQIRVKKETFKNYGCHLIGVPLMTQLSLEHSLVSVSTLNISLINIISFIIFEN